MSASVRNRAANPGTDYNDGNWHPWTGGENPVHPSSEVEVLFPDGMTMDGVAAQEWEWSHDQDHSNIIAFRVVEEFKEPRTFWGYLDRCRLQWEFTEDEAYADYRHDPASKSPVIEMKEVLW